jgi:quercetin dioxygenase-like cupin family protein
MLTSNMESNEGSSKMSTSTATGQPLWFFVNLARVLVTPEESNESLGIVELTGTRGEMPPLHIHHREDEAFVVLDGELTIYTPGESVTLRAGDAAFAPKGVPHAYRVESERARWLGVSNPAGLASFVLAASDPAEANDLPPADRPVDMERLVAAAEAHGIEIVAPPGTTP